MLPIDFTGNAIGLPEDFKRALNRPNSTNGIASQDPKLRTRLAAPHSAAA